MCGIAGYFDKSENSAGPIGATVLNMLRALGSRGPDSAGVALYRPPVDSNFLLQINLGENGHSQGYRRERCQEGFHVVKAKGHLGDRELSPPDDGWDTQPGSSNRSD